MNPYLPKYERLFSRNLLRYASLRDRIKRCVEQVIIDPYTQTEILDDVSGKLNLKGCRSIRINRNFRIIFVVCEKCRRIPDCEYCLCEELPDNTVVFLTIGPHDKAYVMK